MPVLSFQNKKNQSVNICGAFAGYNGSVMSTYESQLLYYKKHCKDDAKYKDTIIRMLADMKSKGNDDQLRK